MYSTFFNTLEPNETPLQYTLRNICDVVLYTFLIGFSAQLTRNIKTIVCFSTHLWDEETPFHCIGIRSDAQCLISLRFL